MQGLPKAIASPQKFVRTRSCKKQIVATFFTRSGHLTSIPVTDTKTVTANWYSTECLPLVVDAIKQKCSKIGCRGMMFHHDNAPAHSAKVIR